MLLPNSPISVSGTKGKLLGVTTELAGGSEEVTSELSGASLEVGASLDAGGSLELFSVTVQAAIPKSKISAVSSVNNFFIVFSSFRIKRFRKNDIIFLVYIIAYTPNFAIAQPQFRHYA